MNYDIKLYIELELISDSLIAEQITVRRREEESALMSFTLITAGGTQDINTYTGKNVRLLVVADSGSYRLFDGKIDHPTADLIKKRIYFQCSTNRKKLIDELDVSMIGIWSDAIFNDTETPSEELDQRLKTTPETLDFDVDNNYTLNDINPKASPDFTLQGNDIFYRDPSVSVVATSELTNNTEVKFSYRYPRKRQRERISQVGTATFCEVVSGQKSYTNVERALDNIAGSGWNVNADSIGANPLPPSGLYTCYGGTPFIWYNIDDPGSWVLSVFYTAAYRFAQTIVEEHTITVKAPQSITQYGEKNKTIEHSLDIDYNVSVWEKNDAYYSNDGLTYDVNDYYLDEDGTVEDYDFAVKTALNIARTEILNSHRNNIVSFETFLFPNLELKHTVKVDSDQVIATGKVTSIEHVIDISKRFGITSVDISFSTATGSQSEDTITAPTRPAIPVVGDKYEAPLIIEDTDADIVAPAIDDLSRNTQTVEATATYNIEIPNSALTVVF